MLYQKRAFLAKQALLMNLVVLKKPMQSNDFAYVIQAMREFQNRYLKEPCLQIEQSEIDANIF